MEYGSRDMVHGIRTASLIEGVCIGQKWQTAACFYFVHNLTNIDRTDKPVVSPLTKMKFDSSFIPVCDNLRKPGAVKEPLYFHRCALLI
jgi:hypothetical protein